MKVREALLAALLGASPIAHAAQSVADDALKDVLIDLERRSWVAWKGHDAAFFSDFLSDDHVEVGPRGILGKADIVAGVGSPVASSLYAKRGARWVNVLYQQAPAAP